MAPRHLGLEHRKAGIRLLIADLEASRGPGLGGDSTPPSSLCRVFGPLAALGVELVHATTVEETQGRLAAEHFDVLVGCAEHFGSGPLRSGAKMRQQSAIPILLVANPEDPIPAVIAGRALRRSQWDLVHLDAPPEELLLRTERLIEQRALLEDLERANYHASHDDRTGLLRPARFDGRLREHFSAAQRHRLELALILVDLDDFGAVNKRYDHTVGDELISRAGSVIRMSLRTEDVGARIGGDEFALILPYTQRVDAARVVSRLSGRFRALSGPPPHRYSGSTPAPAAETGASIHVSASIGFETFNGADLESPDELRQHAERALRAAKERGGDQGIYFRSLEADAGAAPGPRSPIHGPALDRRRGPGTSSSMGLSARLPQGHVPAYKSAERPLSNEHRTKPVRPIQDEVAGGIDFEDE